MNTQLQSRGRSRPKHYVGFACLLGMLGVFLSTPITYAQDNSCPYGCPEGSEVIKFEWDDKNDDGNGCYAGFLVETPDGDVMDGSQQACFEPDGDGLVSFEGYELPIVIVSVTLDGNEIKGAEFASIEGLAESAYAWFKAGTECTEIDGTPYGGEITSSTKGISHIAICYRPTAECPYPEFTEEVLGGKPAQVKLTVSSSSGIEGVNFVDDNGDPYLINFTVSSSDLVSSDGIHWAPSGSLPTTAVLILTHTPADPNDGYAAYYAEVENGCGSITHIDPALQFDVVPEKFKLEGNYPNPFNPTTQIRFMLAEPAAVTVTVYDITGREVKNLVLDRQFDAGVHSAEWDGTDIHGRAAVSGVYLYRVDAGGQSANGKMILLK